MIPNRESIEWGKQKAKELEDTPFYMDAVKLHVLVKYAEKLQCIVDSIQPGKLEQFVEAIWELAWECGESELSSRPPTLAIREELERLRMENRQLKLKNQHSLANNLCPDHRDKQKGKPCLACEIDRLEKLERSRTKNSELNQIAQTLVEIADSDDHEKAMLNLVELADEARELLK